MSSEGTVIRTKLLPPRPHRRVLARPRLTGRLLEALDYRLTVLHAGAGYGKSTALAALAGEGYPLIWYHLDAEDADPTPSSSTCFTPFAPAAPTRCNSRWPSWRNREDSPPGLRRWTRWWTD